MHWSIDGQNRAWDHRKIKIDYLNFFFDIHMITSRWIDHRFYYYIDQLNGSLIFWWLFENKDFVRQRWEFFSIVEFNKVLVTWETVNSLLLRIWADFSRWAKKCGFWKGSKNKVLQLAYKIEHMKEIQRKTISLNLKLVFF